MTDLSLRCLTIYFILIKLDSSYPYSDEPRLKINKCCEAYELLVGAPTGTLCTHVNHTSTATWEPGLKIPYR